MNKPLTLLRIPLVVFIAVLFGLFGFTLLFSDFGVSETAGSRILLIVVYNLLAGWIIGFLTPRYAWLSGIAGWSGFALGIVAFLVSMIRLDIRETVFSFLPTATVLLTLLGGKIGSLMRNRK